MHNDFHPYDNKSNVFIWFITISHTQGYTLQNESLIHIKLRHKITNHKIKPRPTLKYEHTHTSKQGDVAEGVLRLSWIIGCVTKVAV